MCLTTSLVSAPCGACADGRVQFHIFLGKKTVVAPRDRDQKAPTKGKTRSSTAPGPTIEGTVIPEAIKKTKELASLGDAVLPTKSLLPDPQVAVAGAATAAVPGVHVGSVSAGSLTGSSSQSAPAYKPPFPMPSARSTRMGGIQTGSTTTRRVRGSG